MCLYIDTQLHPMIGDYDDSNTVREPIMTKRPLVVWKYLERKQRYDKDFEPIYYWESPYQGMLYEFGKLYKSEIYREDDEVENGLHAYRGGTRKAAYENSGLSPDDAPWRVLFPALIPAGSKIFVSDDGEVVSTQLIVFSDMKSLKAYTGVSRLARPVHAQNLKK